MLLLGAFSFAQSTIKGTILDDKGFPVSAANVILKPENSQSIIAYGYSNETGNYELTTYKTGSYVLSFSALNYETVSFEVVLTHESKTILQDASLVYKAIALNEVVIESNRPITIKKDTIVFDVKAFIQGNEEVVEDLLKKIPGLTVDSDGTIKAGNQEVEKVMVDNDDFFEKGYKVLTKNMPSSPIEKVELLQHYSNNKHLKGIENSEKVALNLVLKDDAKRQWFGNFLLGYGLISENRYEGRSNLMNFGKKNKYYFLTNLNNTGETATGDISSLIYSFGDEQIGDNEKNQTILGLEVYVPQLKQKRVNFNNAELISLNSIFTLSPKIKLKAMAFINQDENNFYRNSSQSFFANNIFFQNTEDFTLRKNTLVGFGKIDFDFNISSTKNFQFTSKLSNTRNKDRSELLFNDNLLQERLNSNNHLLDQKIVFTNKITTNKAWLISARVINEKTPQTYELNQFLYDDLFSSNANNIAQINQNEMAFYGIESYLLNREKAGNLLEIKFGNQYRRDVLHSNFQIKNGNQLIDNPLGYQNNTVYGVNDLYAILKYAYRLKKINLVPQIDLHQFFNTLEIAEMKASQTPFFINPKLGIEYEMNKKNKILASYAFNTTNASILDVYSNYVHSGFRSFTKGTGTFNQLEASNALLSYTYGNWGDKFFASTFIMYSRNHDFLSTHAVIAQNYSQYDKIQIKDRDLATLSSSVDYYFRPVSSNLKLVVGGTKTNYKNVVNNSNLRAVKNNLIYYGLELRSGFKGIFNYHTGTKWDYNEVTTTINNSFTNNTLFLDLSFVLNSKMNFQIQTERYFFGNLEKKHNTYYFMDLEAKYTVKENKLSFFLSGNNLFNTTSFKNYSVNDISISNTEYRLQPRYVLLKMDYRF
ncbi:conserved hypothetical protein [Flavobacterium sp. 9AF]|nr:conserved hypothetical protein [Flavobacterium sp. 9AF]